MYEQIFFLVANLLFYAIIPQNFSKFADRQKFPGRGLKWRSWIIKFF